MNKTIVEHNILLFEIYEKKNKNTAKRSDEYKVKPQAQFYMLPLNTANAWIKYTSHNTAMHLQFTLHAELYDLIVF